MDGRLKFLSILVFLANLNCVWVDPADRKEGHLPPHLANRLCPESVKVRESDDLSRDFVTPTKRLAVHEYPRFNDDLDFEALDVALERQLERFRRRSLSGSIQLGQDKYPLVKVRDTLNRFQQLMNRTRICLAQKGEARKGECYDVLQQSLQQHYAVYVPALEPGDPRFNEPEPVLFTGYYTPLIQVKRKPDAEFRYPIYNKPQDEWVSRIGRFQIDFRDGLKGYGLEIFYAKDLFGLYLLHLEGGGRVQILNDKGRIEYSYVSYAGSNGRQWRFLSALMLNKNWLYDPAVPYQREFIEQNPHLAAEIFSYCPSYVFFKETSHPPEGSDVVPLTDNRSIATDYRNYGMKGMLAFVRTKRPRPMNGVDKEIEMIPFSRFVLDQDTGGAIKGKGRVDFYFGEGEYAELAANTLKQRGDLFYLILK